MSPDTKFGRCHPADQLLPHARITRAIKQENDSDAALTAFNGSESISASYCSTGGVDALLLDGLLTTEEGQRIEQGRQVWQEVAL